MGRLIWRSGEPVVRSVIPEARFLLLLFHDFPYGFYSGIGTGMVAGDSLKNGHFSISIVRFYFCKARSESGPITKPCCIGVSLVFLLTAAEAVDEEGRNVEKHIHNIINGYDKQ